MKRLLLLSLLALLGSMSIIACDSSEPKKLTGGQKRPSLCPPMYDMSPGGCVPISNPPTDVPAGPVSYIMEVNNPHGDMGMMWLESQSAYKYFIKKAMQVCDRSQGLLAGDYGLADCENWVRGYQSVMISFDSAFANQATVQIMSFPVYTGYTFSFQLSLWPNTAGVGFNPLLLNMNLHPINNNAGFELRSNGSNFNEAYGSLIQLIVDKGHLTATGTYLDLNMHFEGKRIARGRAYRCQNFGCGFY